MKEKTWSITRICAVASGIAVLMLIAMALVPWPFDFQYPGEEVLAGKIVLSPPDLERFVDGAIVYLVLDGAFVIAWFVSWIGLAVVVMSRSALLGKVALIMGLSGAALDFAQNAVEWALIQGMRMGIAPGSGGFFAWEIVTQLSYLLPFAAAVIFAIGVWSEKPLDRVFGVIGIPLAIPAIVGLYVQAFYPLTFLWYVAIFACTGALLWRRSGTEKSQNGAGNA